jgi:CheY-like chemotaxis protein
MADRSHVLAGTSVLIIEDNPLVALDVHAILSAAGASVISASSAGEAAELIRYADIAAAIVDIHLGGEDAAEACRLLARRRVPFAFYTGHAGSASLCADWPKVPVLTKPADPAVIVRTIVSLLQAGAKD